MMEGGAACQAFPDAQVMAAGISGPRQAGEIG